MTLHTTFQRGKTLHVGMRDGTSVVGKFHSTDYKRKVMRFDVDGALQSLPLRRIRFASIRRHQLEGVTLTVGKRRSVKL